ncbi:MAG: S8 family serine peptidase [Cyanobacteria bacterium P01_H01_bin.153]
MSAIAPRIDSTLLLETVLNPADSHNPVHLAELPSDNAAELALLALDEQTLTLAAASTDAAWENHAETALLESAIALEFLASRELPIQQSISADDTTDPLTGTVDDWTNRTQRSRNAPDLPINLEASDNAADFDPLIGYGLVDAAAAVSAALGQVIDTEVPDSNAVNWGNDLINAPEVWAEGITGEGVVVAVIDSGTDITHPELSGNLWTNEGEIFGDGLDNDGNGFADDIYGWNFEVGQFDNLVLPGTMNPGQDHGTHVAGIIAAANDGVGITGVAYDAQIMSIRLGDVGPGPTGESVFLNGGSLIDAIYYAVDNGADVINMSLGTGPSPALEAALAYAASKNVFVVSAAGNSGTSAPNAPASYAVEYGASVGAVDSGGNLAFFSNQAGFDPDIQHVTAPGVSVYSTLPDGEYGFKSGTSMAAPYVAGVVALMRQANPDLTVDEIGEILTTTTT